VKFGPVQTQDAEGAILAHSVYVGTKRLRKGAALSQEDIAKLTDAGISEVIVAQLEDGDVPENEAASQIADGISNPQAAGLNSTSAFTGRVNLNAARSGVVRVDAAKISALNSVNPMITIATVPDHHLADAGTMLATIKIISFAVPREDVEKARFHISDAISVHSPELKTARLIVTELEGVRSEKGIQAIKDRLSRWDVELTAIAHCPHAAESLMAELNGCEEDLVLILTASATSDINDIAPAAVVKAGGAIERFGMPVDPGNLLFIGGLAASKVIGLPGCARSPALNGTDWVLARVICGIDVSSNDIAAMGVGGLLKDIPTRPHPRSRKAK